MARSATYFLSDLHLGSRFLADPLEAEKRVVRFLDSISSDAEQIFLVGDILDYWFEYKYAVPRGYTRFLGTLARLSDSGVKITWLIGNHDIWIFDYLPKELGIRVIDGVLTEQIYGKNFFITHGDGVGKLPKKFRFIRSLFRNKICQKLYSGIHPRWTIPFAHGWSHTNRDSHPVPTPFQGENESLIEFSRKYLINHPDINYFIYGHRHILVQEPLTSTCQFIILGDWIDKFSYARFTTEEGLTLHQFQE